MLVQRMQVAEATGGYFVAPIMLKPKAMSCDKVFGDVKWFGLAFVLLAHAALILSSWTNGEVEVVSSTTVPMMVSLVAPPALKPTIKLAPKPIVKPKAIVKKTVKKPTIKPKPVVTKHRPVSRPSEPVAQTEPTEQAAVARTIAAETTQQVESAAQVVEKEVIEPPKFGVAYLNNPAPKYPRLSRRAEEQGRVLLKVLVSAEGAAQEVSIEKSSRHHRLDKAAIAAVKRWRFIPAKKGNIALSAYVLVPINFALKS